MPVPTNKKDCFCFFKSKINSNTIYWIYCLNRNNPLFSIIPIVLDFCIMNIAMVQVILQAFNLRSFKSWHTNPLIWSENKLMHTVQVLYPSLERNVPCHICDSVDHWDN